MEFLVWFFAMGVLVIALAFLVDWKLGLMADHIDAKLAGIAKRLHEIEDTRPVNKINIVGDVSVPKGQAFALNINESSTIGTGWIKP
jgi:hypothetical protein